MISITRKYIGYLIAGITLYAVCVAPLLADERPWELVRESDGIKVYSRMIEGSQKADFKGESEENVDIDTVASILLDIPSYPAWIKYIKESRIIKKIDDDNFYVYQRFMFFWPYKDRDIIVKIHIERPYEKGYLFATMDAVNDTKMYPPRKDCVRMSEMTGEITVRYVSSGVTEGNFQEQFTPGGHVPDWIAKKINEFLPLVVLQKLREEAARKGKSADTAISDAIEKSLNNGK